MLYPTNQLINNACTTPTDQQCMNSYSQTQQCINSIYSHMQITKQFSSKLVDTKIVLIRISSKEKDNQNREGEERAPRKEAKTYEEKG